MNTKFGKNNRRAWEQNRLIKQRIQLISNQQQIRLMKLANKR